MGPLEFAAIIIGALLVAIPATISALGVYRNGRKADAVKHEAVEATDGQDLLIRELRRDRDYHRERADILASRLAAIETGPGATA